MKIRLSKSLKNNEIAFSNATERDEISRHYYAITMHGFLKVQTRRIYLAWFQIMLTSFALAKSIGTAFSREK